MTADSARVITKKSRSSFYYSFNLLPKEKREAIYTVYAFCKKTDDIVDEHRGTIKEKERLLSTWRLEFKKSFNGGTSNSLLQKLYDTAQRFKIPVEHFHELLNGVEMDLTKNRYESFEELYTYCYRVASTVGLICAEIFGYTREHTRQYAINLGIALQLTNILRDVKSDLARDRIYLPLEDLRRFGYTEDELRSCVYNEPFVGLMRFQAQRARSFYLAANRNLAKEDEKYFFAARIMEKIYFSVLKKIERNNYNVFKGKIRVHRLRQLLIALNIWFNHRVLPTR